MTEGMYYGHKITKVFTIFVTFLLLHVLQRQKIVSAITSTQISDNDNATVNLDGETVELMIEIGMVFACVIVP